MKLAIVSTHPIQCHIPWYQALAKQPDIDLTVYYAFVPNPQQQGKGFGISFTWDIPMLEGYKWELLKKKVGATSILAVLAKSRPDAVIITGWQSLALIQALLACITLRIPRIVRGASNALRKRKWYIRYLHSIFLYKYDAFLAIGKANKAFYLQYSIAEERIFECNYFVDNARFKDEADDYQKDRNIIRRYWDIPDAHVCFIYAGKLEPKKRIMDLLLAIELSIKKRKDICLLVVGTGDLMEQAKRYVIEKKLPVTFAGFLNQTEISRAYVAADCLVLPSDYGETWGLVVNEGMVCGLPAIVSDRVGCGPDLIKDGVTGYVFSFGDINALANKLIEMASDADKLITMGVNAQKLIWEYSVEKAVEGTHQAIEFVCKKNKHLGIS